MMTPIQPGNSSLRGASPGPTASLLKEAKRTLEPILIMALNEYGFQEMAEAFLNCGNDVLKRSRHGVGEEARLHYHAGDGEAGDPQGEAGRGEETLTRR